jgi:uncharacterized Tic20 family protein
MSTTNEKNTATLLHLSTLSQYIIPFGNYIFPIIIWSSKKDDSEFVDCNGKQVLNFQLSILLYSLLLLLIVIPILIFTVLKNITYNEVFHNHEIMFNHFKHENLTGVIILGVTAVLIFGFLKVIEFILIINGAVKASNGENYKYPMSIPFFK